MQSVWGRAVSIKSGEVLDLPELTPALSLESAGSCPGTVSMGLLHGLWGDPIRQIK